MKSEELGRLRTRLVELIGDTESDEPKARKRRLILDAATRLFVKHGFRKTSVDEVAEASGVAKGTVYLYFKNKGELMVACICLEKLGQFERFTFLADADLTAQEKLIQFVELALLATRDMPLSMRLVQRDAELASVIAAMPAELMQDNARDRYALLVPLLREATIGSELPEDELRPRADILIGAGFLAGHLGHEHVRGALAQDEFASRFAAAVVKGVL